MASPDDMTKYKDVTETLANTFGAVLSRDVIYTIVESFSGDLNQAANAIMTITSDDSVEDTAFQNTSCQTSTGGCQESEGFGRNNSNYKATGHKTSNIELSTINCKTNAKPSMSYATASTSKAVEVISQQVKKPPCIQRRNTVNSVGIWTEQIKQIVTDHNNGKRTLILMRGAPGSGKSYLARQIQEMTVGSTSEQLHILSADDYFLKNGVYKYDKFLLKDAHLWNQLRAFEAMNKGVSPIIIDNTNIELWEMEPYAKHGVLNGYAIEVVEPSNPWSRSLRKLMSRNIHGVPARSIQQKLDALSYTNISSANILSSLKLEYPSGMTPPVLRRIPKICTRADENCQVPNIQKANTSLQQKLTLDKQSPNVDSEITSHTLGTNKRFIGTQNDVNNCTNYPQIKTGGCSAEMFVTEKVNCHQTIKSTILQEPVGSSTIETKGSLPIVYEPIYPDKHTTDTNKNSQSNELLKNVENDQSYNPNQHKRTQSSEDELILKGTPETTSTQASACNDMQEGQVNSAKFLEEFEKVESEWENGEAWNEDTKTKDLNFIVPQLNISTDAKLPRVKRTEPKKLVLTMDQNNDWRKISMFTPTSTEISNMPLKTAEPIVETKETGTCMEIGDTEINNRTGINIRYKIVTARARDINVNYVKNESGKIPLKRMLDKSSMTIEPMAITGAHRCKNEDKHFISFRKMFRHLNKDDLRDIFDKCCGDVNWAVSIVLDDMANKQFEYITVDEQSETEEDNDVETCECTAQYDIIPYTTIEVSDIKNDENMLDINSSSSAAIQSESSYVIKKHKKDSQVSDESLALKRQIEHNIVISDQHYSENCLKVRKMRRGEWDGDACMSPIIATGITMQNSNQLDNIEVLSVNNTDTNNLEICEPSPFEVSDTEEESDDESNFNEVEESVNVTLGYEFLSQLDAFFGRKGMQYSENIEPKARIPMSLLNEINALWIESLMFQLDQEYKLHEDIIKQDEEFARELAVKEIEMSNTGSKPTVPDLKEIMDIEYALSLYRKDCEEWLKDRPTDLATKLSSQKLYDLFPEIHTADLDEIYTAHHYDFQATVSVLLLSQGRLDITEVENGIQKFIVAGELKRQEKYLAEEKKRLSEEEWPALPTRIDLDIVQEYRDKANSHLEKRQINFKKANEYMRAGMTAVASYYSDIASLHKVKYEQANSLAAATLMQYHASNADNADTLDLHYLRVTEAKQALDMFLDSHIQYLKQAGDCNKSCTVFFITGRGRHSSGGPKVKPAVKKRLRERGLIYCERNPGLLASKIRAGDKLSYQLS